MIAADTHQRLSVVQARLEQRAESEHRFYADPMKVHLDILRMPFLDETQIPSLSSITSMTPEERKACIKRLIGLRPKHILEPAPMCQHCAGLHASDKCLLQKFAVEFDLTNDEEA